MFGMKPYSKSAAKLFMEGAIALSRIEQTGIPICEKTLADNQAEITRMIREKETEMRDSPIYYRQRRKWGKNANINARDQLSRILFDELGIEGGTRSANGKYVLDDAVLDNLELTGDAEKYIKNFRQLAKLYKLNGTYLEGIKREVVDGRLHGFFNLHLVGTYRSSSDCPNLQNLPIRNPLGSKYIRSCVRPSKPGWVLVETDYSTLEVVIGACIHKDPNMRQHLLEKYDFHKATAAETFFLEEVPKVFRNLGKTANFSLVYGDYYVSIAAKLWKGMKGQKIGDKPILEHLSDNGIKRLGSKDLLSDDSFMLHVKKVTDRFWQERFPVFHQWRNDTWSKYQRTGEIYSPTGFRFFGPYKRTEIFNVETQQSAFACLLQSVIEMNKRIDRLGFSGRIVSQIHDSILSEVPEEEVDDYVAELDDVMTTHVHKIYPWITIPLSTETETSAISWHDKKLYTPKAA